MSTLLRNQRGRRWTGAFVLCAGITFGPDCAQAGEVRLRSQTYGEGYVLVAAGPSAAVIPRRRLVQYVHIGVFDLLPPTDPRTLRRDPEDGQLQWVSSLRIRHDFGAYLQAPTSTAQRLVDQIDGRQVDLMFAYLEGERLWGWVDTRLGRQFSSTGLDFFAFDGGWVRMRTPSPVAISIFGGTMVQGADALGYVTYELDGVDTSKSSEVVAPTFGAEVSLLGLPRLRTAVGYRQTMETVGRADVPDTGSPVTLQSLIAAQVEVSDLKRKARLSGALRYDFGVSTISDARVDGELQLFGWQALHLGYARTHPVFSLDSVFNVFERAVVEEVRAAWELRFGSSIRVQSVGSLRLFRPATTSATTPGSNGVDATSQGGGVTVDWRRSHVWSGTSFQALAGRGGQSMSGMLYAGGRLLWDRMRLDGRLYANRVQQPESTVGGFVGQGWNVAAQLVARARLFDGIFLSLLQEPGASRDLRWSYRTMAVLSVDWTTRGGRR